jgi:ribonucleoside-triphosphate reductase
LVLAGGEPTDFPAVSEYSDEFVELVGWVAAEGWFDSAAVVVGQDPTIHPDFCRRIEKLSDFYQGSVYERRNGFLHWYFPVLVGREVQKVVSVSKEIDPAFLASLTLPQAQLLFEVLLDGDGETQRVGGRERLYQSSWGLIDSFQMLAMMLGKRSIAKLSDTPRGEFGGKDGTVGVHHSRTANMKWMDRTVRHYRGRVWCPTTSVGTWVTRRKEVMQPRSDISHGDQGSIFKKTVYVTGNCFPE